MKKIILTIVLGAVLIPSFSFASINKNLSYGAKGAQVTELQEFLIDKGFLQTQSTGNFYSLTLKAVKAFQSVNNIPNTGYVGNLTRTEINSELSAETANSISQQLLETGTTTSPVATTSPVVTQLQQQNNLLQQQLNQLQTQVQQTQTIQSSLNQVVQNTTPTTTVSLGQTSTPVLSVSCVANPSTVNKNQSTTFTSSVAISRGTGNYTYSWSGACTGFNANCSNSFSQIGTQIANLAVTFGSQVKTTNCSASVICSPNWQCGSWGTCTNSQQTRTCSDQNSCGTSNGQPLLTQSCTPGAILSSDANLSSLNINGTSVANFSPSTFVYNYLLPSNTTTIPVITASANNANARVAISQATSVTGSASILVTAQDGRTQQTYMINFSLIPTLTVANDTSVSIPTYAVAGSVNNNLLGLGISTNSTQGISLAGSSIIVTDNISNNSNGFASFKNLTLWQGSTEISGPVQMTVGSDGVGTIIFQLSNSPAITVQNNSPLSFQIHGDVNSLSSNSVALNSSHSFNITGSSITGSFQYQGTQTSVSATGNANGSSIIVLPYYAKQYSTGAGNDNNTVANLRYYSTNNDIIATINVGADPIETGSVTANSITLRLTGTGLFNQWNPSRIGVFPVNLLGSGGNILDTEQCIPVTSSGVGTCSITFPLNTTISSGNSITYTLQNTDPVIQKVDTGNGSYQNVQLFLDDVVWTDGTTPNIHWNSSNQPTRIFNYTYQ